jgi:hypothetical protein
MNVILDITRIRAGADPEGAPHACTPCYFEKIFRIRKMLELTVNFTFDPQIMDWPQRRVVDFHIPVTSLHCSSPL